MLWAVQQRVGSLFFLCIFSSLRPSSGNGRLLLKTPYLSSPHPALFLRRVRRFRRSYMYPLCCPILAEKLRLLQNRLGRFLLFIWWVSVLSEDPFNESAQLRADAFFYCPINRRVLPHGIK